MRRQKVEFRAQLQAEIFFDKEVNAFVSYCPALDIYAQADTEMESREAMAGAIMMFIKTCYDRNTLDNVLNARGFRNTKRTDDGKDDCDDVQRISVRPIRERRSLFDVDVDVPFELIRHAGDGSAVESAS